MNHHNAHRPPLHLVEPDAPAIEMRLGFLHVVVIGALALIAGAGLVAVLLEVWR